MKITTTHILLGVIVIGGILFGIDECNDSNRSDRLVESVANYNDTAEFYKMKNGAVVAFNQSLVLENKEQMESLLLKYDTLSRVLKKFSSIQSTTIIHERTVIQNDTIRLQTEIPCDFAPIRVRRDSLHYVFDGRITPKSLIIDSIVIPSRLDIVIGTKKLGLFKRERRVEIIPSNPLIHITSIKNFVIDDRKKWYQKTGTKLALGALLGGAGVYYLRK